jgi:hypothetical protein
MQTKLDTITSEYQQKQISYAKNAESMSPEEADEYVNFCSTALFRIHVIEKRLAVVYFDTINNHSIKKMHQKSTWN